MKKVYQLYMELILFRNCVVVSLIYQIQQTKNTMNHIKMIQNFCNRKFLRLLQSKSIMKYDQKIFLSFATKRDSKGD